MKTLLLNYTFSLFLIHKLIIYNEWQRSTLIFFGKYCEGSPRVEGDEDEEDVDDIEHEFNMDDERNKHKYQAEAMLHGKMSYGRGPEDEENSQFPPVISGRSRPVRELKKLMFVVKLLHIYEF